ncbi:MAG TPA: hypothetical protein VHO95_07025, partial [Candidatus Dormibacteraeota bacterium]|nr:hypothetical protein [Candidatus Dormibacteraeota bacterium]
DQALLIQKCIAVDVQDREESLEPVSRSDFFNAGKSVHYVLKSHTGPRPSLELKTRFCLPAVPPNR